MFAVRVLVDNYHNYYHNYYHYHSNEWMHVINKTFTSSTRMLWGKLLYSVFCCCREESLVRDTNLHYKDCSEMHSGSCSQMTSSCRCHVLRVMPCFCLYPNPRSVDLFSFVVCCPISNVMTPLGVLWLCFQFTYKCSSLFWLTTQRNNSRHMIWNGTTIDEAKGQFLT